MGSWNGTCGISQLPIISGDPIVVTLISRSPWVVFSDTGHDFCYPYGKWWVLSFPFEAKYNDYGSFEDVVETPYFDVSMKHIKENLVEKEIGENKYHDIAVKRDNFDLDLLRSSIHEGRLEVHSSYATLKSVPVGHFFIHQEIYNAILNHSFTESYGNVLESYTTAATRLKDRHSIFGISDSLFHGYEGYSRVFREYIDKTFMDNNGSLSEEDLEMMSKVFALTRFMTQIRKAYQPQTGAGSQSEGYDEHKVLTAVMTKVITASEKRYDEEDC